jgi:hypothetical protein
MRWLVAALAIAAVVWSWQHLFGSGFGCETIAYPVRCRGAVIGNRCHGTLVEALPRRRFLVDPGAQRVTEAGSGESRARCRVQDCRRWDCIDEVFVRSAGDGEFRQLLRPGLAPLDPRWTPSEVYVPAWLWWKIRAQALAARAFAAIVARQRT